MKVLFGLLMMLVLNGCGNDGSNGKDGEGCTVSKSGTVSCPDGTKYKIPNGKVTDSTYCQYRDISLEILFHIEWSNLSNGDRFIKCMAITGSGLTTTNSNYRSSLDPYNDQCLLTLSDDSTLGFQFKLYNHSRHATVTYSKGVRGMSCDRQTFN